MPDDFLRALAPHVVVIRTEGSIPGRELFAMPDRWERNDGPTFDAIELAPVGVFEGGICEAYESIADIPKAQLSQILWSIYGHTPGEGVQCIGDFTSREHALEVIRRLLGDLRPYPGRPG